MTSAVAGIVDRNGGVRTVVTQRWRMRHHVKKGEQLFVVPGFFVQEPVPWDEIPIVIDIVQKHITRTLAPTNHCGDCRACCFTLYIDDPRLKKPSNSWCQNCASDIGCKVYHARPNVCRSFKCEWLASQAHNDWMKPELRPDKCGAIFTKDSQTNDPLLIECHGEPNADAWKWIDEMQAVGYKVKKVTHYIGEGALP